MRVRTFGLLLLIAVAIIPLVVFSYIAVGRSERTAAWEVRAGNQRLADSIAQRIAAYRVAELGLLESIGAAVLQAPTREHAVALLEAYSLDQAHLGQLVVLDADGTVWAAIDVEGESSALARQVKQAPAYGEVVAAAADASGPFAHTQVVAAPVTVAGAREGVIAARVDLVDIWKPVNSIHVGKGGFVRLVTFYGVLLAHGDPEERRYVFAGEQDQDSPLVAGSLMGLVGRNRQGVEALAGVAFVPSQSWMVVVEQPVAEAFAATAAMKKDLIWLVGITLVVVLLIGFGAGGRTVRALERLRAHTQVLAAGDLDQRVGGPAAGRLLELRALADSLDEMAGSIQTLHDEARAKERLETFARVAAGLAHDLRVPIESVRAACHDLLLAPDDSETRDTFQWMAERELPKLQRFVDDLRRIAQGDQVQLQLRDLDPRELADELVQDLANNPKWGGVRFCARGKGAPVLADANLLRRAIFNLASNAADACVTKGPGCEVALEVGDDPDGDLAIRVCDTGTGIEAEKLAELLVGDFRSTKRSSGVGLGFGVARHVAKAHGGKIIAESTPGVGTQFTVVVPRTREPEKLADQRSSV